MKCVQMVYYLDEQMRDHVRFEYDDGRSKSLTQVEFIELMIRRLNGENISKDLLPESK